MQTHKTLRAKGVIVGNEMNLEKNRKWNFRGIKNGEKLKIGRLTGGLMEGAADAGSSDIDRTAFKIKISR